MIVVDMPLLNEGTNVWSSANVEDIGGELYRVLGPMPEDQCWKFPPGTIVQLRARFTSTRNASVEAVEVAGKSNR